MGWTKIDKTHGKPKELLTLGSRYDTGPEPFAPAIIVYEDGHRSLYIPTLFWVIILAFLLPVLYVLAIMII